MKLSQIRHLIAAGERGSINGAARELGIAQPTISRSLQDLETELGVRLFERGRGGLLPTEVGKTVLRRAKAATAELDRILDEVAHAKGDETGRISLGMSTAAQIAILPRILPAFRHRYPQVWLTLTEGLFPLLEQDIRDGLIDIYVGAVVTDVRDDTLRVKILFENRRIIVARRGHPLADARSLRDLAGAAWLTTQVMADSGREVSAMYAAADLPPPNIVAQARSGMSIVTMVASSDLLAPLPRPWRQIIEHIPLIQEIRIAEPTYSPPICSVRRADAPLAPPAQYLFDLVEKAAANYVLEQSRPIETRA